MLSPIEQDVLAKVQRFCAYQERSEWEVRKKLRSVGVLHYKEDLFIDELIETGYIDDSRFAKAFVLGKFRSKKWGRLKIRQGLAEKGIKGSTADNALADIDEEEYFETIHELATIKERTIKANNDYEKKHKIARFLLGRGFEGHLIWEALGRN